ncbi:MAG: hypothetical protein KAH56_12450 [Candidatus Krumholzibacteria bacterium]|nr:hypothetical protein [Candidatus Krumholzibacteria bacterium]
MPFEFRKTMIILATLGCALVGIGEAIAVDEPVDESSSVMAAFDAWAEGLESESGKDSSWEYPFGVPRPADLSSQELKIILSLRRLAWNRNNVELESLADQVNRRQGELPVQLLFWLAYAQNALQQNEACLANLQRLLLFQEGWRNLENGQKAWVLTSTPDLFFLIGNRELAASLYERLAVSPVEQLNLWGKYQLAGMNFLAREFVKASERYSMVCEAELPGTWREHACSMAEIAGRLSQLGIKEETHGAVAISNP